MFTKFLIDLTDKDTLNEIKKILWSIEIYGDRNVMAVGKQCVVDLLQKRISEVGEEHKNLHTANIEVLKFIVKNDELLYRYFDKRELVFTKSTILNAKKRSYVKVHQLDNAFNVATNKSYYILTNKSNDGFSIIDNSVDGEGTVHDQNIADLVFDNGSIEINRMKTILSESNKSFSDYFNASKSNNDVKYDDQLLSNVKEVIKLIVDPQLTNSYPFGFSDEIVSELRKYFKDLLSNQLKQMTDSLFKNVKQRDLSGFDHLIKQSLKQLQQERFARMTREENKQKQNSENIGDLFKVIESIFKK